MLAAALAIAFATSVRSEISSGQAPVIVTNTGTLLSSEAGSINTITTPADSVGGVPESIGTLTLSSKRQMSAEAAVPRNLIDVNNVSVPISSVIADYEVAAAFAYPLPSETASFAPSVVSWQDERVPFDEVTPVPEPSTWLGALLVFALLTYHQRRRFVAPGRSACSGVTE